MCDCGCVFDIPKGIKGDTGATGPTGPAGANGANGAAGAAGADGVFADLVQGYTLYTVSAAAIVTIEPGSDAVFHRVLGTQNLGAAPFSYGILGGPSYTDGMFVEVEYVASLTNGAVSILGNALTAWEALYCEFLFIAKYDAGTSTWYSQKILTKCNDTWHTVGGAGEPAFTANVTSSGALTLKFFKDISGEVHITGMAYATANLGASFKVIFTLPAGYRPAANILKISSFYDDSAVANLYCQVLIDTGGQVTVLFSSNIGINDVMYLGFDFHTA